MTKGDKLNNAINKTYEIDVDDVGKVPECTEFQDHQSKNLYSTPFQTEPVYESPLTMGIATPIATQRRESEQRQGRRSKTNDIYEGTNDGTLSNGRTYDGYTYCRNTDAVTPRLPCTTYDNPLSTTDGEKDHQYEETFRKSRFSENAVYNDAQHLKAFTIEGVRDTKTGTPKCTYGNGRRGQRRATCIQIFTLLLSILAVFIGTLALLVALRTIKLNDHQNENISSPDAIWGGDRDEGNKAPQTEQKNYNELLKKYNETKDQVLSSEKNYINLMAKYNVMKNQAEKNYTNLMNKYNEMIKQFTQRKSSVDTIHQELNGAIQAMNSTFNNKFKNVNSNVSSLSRDLDEVNTELRNVNTFSQQLSNTVEDINSTFTTEIRNVSKKMGPRGFNGAQGLQGPQGPQGAQGVGNMSACIVNEKSYRQGIDKTNANLYDVAISHKQRTGWKVISAVCSTREGYGAIQTVLRRQGDTYTCTCAGPSKYSTFVPVIDKNGKYQMECVIIYWECPKLT